MKQQKKFPGTLSPEVSDREIRHRAIARRAAAEGMVLLKNDGIFPLRAGAKVALYGVGARHTIQGGTGSGSVNNRSSVSVDEGLRNAGFEITSKEWLDDFDRLYEKKRLEWMASIYEMAGTPEDSERLYDAYAAHPMPCPRGRRITLSDQNGADTALFIISRVSGEGADRRAEKGDYYLSDDESEMLSELCAVCPRVSVILNVGGIMDLSFLEKFPISGLILMSQAGMEGGNALADVISGAVNPCGRLTDTWAYRYEDYPSSAGFSHNNGNLTEEKYTEGIYVGYRYFDSFGVKPRYPFGFGLSYTEFSLKTEAVSRKDGLVSLRAVVKNTGKLPGREVVQVYAACPSSLSSSDRYRKWLKEKKRLAAFAKTRILPAGGEETLTLSFPISRLTSYHAGKAAYFLEKGNYYILLGTNSQETAVSACLSLDRTVKYQQLTNICPLLDALREIRPEEADVTKWEWNLAEECKRAGAPVLPITESDLRDAETISLDKSSPVEAHWLKKAKELTLEEKSALVCGRPGVGPAEFIGAAATKVPGAAGETTSLLLEKHSMPNIVLADGPAGLRLQARYEENPEDGSIYLMPRYQALENRFFGKEFLHKGSVFHYQYCSAIPVGTLLAQSFDPELLAEVGEMIGKEMEEFGITLWLAPGMNIHRNPLCGRNFEYYSEDPLVSGIMAASITRGVQKIPGAGTTIKHFACNNQEDNRRGVSSIVSERALREIYLKGFEIAVKESQPMAIMTSYNKINSVHTANSRDLCTTAVRKEWGFRGIIMTDWTTTNGDGGSSAAKCISAGNDLIMPGKVSDIREIMDAVKQTGDQYLEEQKLEESAARMIRLIHSAVSPQSAD